MFQTSSVGSPRTRVYNSISAEVDDYLFLYDLLSFQSMSNANRTPDVRPQAWAKNIVGVGGISHRNTQSRSDDFSSGSSGPAQDGRIKPDLAHFYDSIFTTTTNGYTPSFGGTSGATPITAGLSGLFFQMWHEGVFPGHGGGTSVFDSRAKMATAKAMLINSAFKYSLSQGGLGRINQGWGMISLRKMYNHRDLMFIVDETDLLAPLGVNCYEVEVAAGENQLAVTMVYTDPMGPTSSTQHRINDLSLRVTSPGGVSYWGNNGLMTSNLSAPGGSSNTKDTVENVFVQNPEAGMWTVEVLGDEIIEDSHPETPELDADYALVVAGVVNGAACGSCEPCDMNCDGAIDALDIEFFIDLLFNGTDPCCGNRGEVGSTGDVNLDGSIDAADIEGFINCLFP
ncbi:MAG: S8 family serine peptidase [Planctomycetes bacterium]|nr:S8 family serine peptidase [Planctomycetota bacterium]